MNKIIPIIIICMCVSCLGGELNNVLHLSATPPVTNTTTTTFAQDVTINDTVTASTGTFDTINIGNATDKISVASVTLDADWLPVAEINIGADTSKISNVYCRTQIVDRIYLGTTNVYIEAQGTTNILLTAGTNSANVKWNP